MNKVSVEMIQDWTENPVTEVLLSLSSEELNDIQGTPATDCYAPGDPYITQDQLANLAAREGCWSVFCDLLQGDWSYMESEDEDGD